MPPYPGRKSPACLPLQTLVLEALVHLHRQFNSSQLNSYPGATAAEVRDHLLFSHEGLGQDMESFERSLLMELHRGARNGQWSIVYSNSNSNTRNNSMSCISGDGGQQQQQQEYGGVPCVRFKPLQEDVSSAKVRVYKKPSDKRLRARAVVMRSRSGEYSQEGMAMMEGVRGLSIAGNGQD